MGRKFAKKINKMYNKESIIFSRGRIKAYKVKDISYWILSFNKCVNIIPKLFSVQT